MRDESKECLRRRLVVGKPLVSRKLFIIRVTFVQSYPPYFLYGLLSLFLLPLNTVLVIQYFEPSLARATASQDKATDNGTTNGIFTRLHFVCLQQMG